MVVKKLMIKKLKNWKKLLINTLINEKKIMNSTKFKVEDILGDITSEDSISPEQINKIE